jgi:hypothetical protein
VPPTGPEVGALPIRPTTTAPERTAGFSTLDGVTSGDASPTTSRRARTVVPDSLEELSKVDDAPAPIGAPVLPSIVEAMPVPGTDAPAPVRPSVPQSPASAPSDPASMGAVYGGEPLPEVAAPVGAALAPASVLPRQLLFRRRPRVRRVTRVVRHVDTWSVFKVALVFNAVLYVVCLSAGVLLWNVAYATGTIDNVEQFFEQFGWSSFEFKGGQIYHNAWVAGLFVAVGLTGFMVLLATLFNLITDLVGGIRVSVLEEEVVVKPRPPEGAVLPSSAAVPGPVPVASVEHS